VDGKKTFVYGTSMIKHPRVLRFFLSLIVMGLLVFLLRDSLSPSLWYLGYDQINARRAIRDGSALISIVNPSENPAASLGFAEALQTLQGVTEFAPSVVVLQSPFLSALESNTGQDTPDGTTEQSVDREFGSIKGNIRTLFDAIRLGSIRPQDADRYVDSLIALVDESRKRLGSPRNAERDGDFNRLARFSLAVGNVFLPEDTLNLNPIPPGTGALFRGYSRFDRSASDRIRGIQPFKIQNGTMVPHVALGALERFLMVNGIILHQHTLLVGNRSLPLDFANTLLVPPRRFRTIPQSLLLDYATQDRELYLLLKTMEKKGYFAGLDPSLYPSSLYDYALTLQAALEKGETRTAQPWREARRQYIRSLETLAQGKLWEDILSGLDAVGSEGGGTPGTQKQLGELKNAVEKDFADFLQRYRAFLDQRNNLEKALAGTFCVIGGDSETTALLAQAVLTGQTYVSIDPPALLLIAGAWAVLVAAFLLWFRPLASLVVGLAAAALGGVVGTLIFVATGLWLAPALLFAAAAATAGVSVLGGTLLRYLSTRLPGERRPIPVLPLALVAVRLPLSLYPPVGNQGDGSGSLATEAEELRRFRYKTGRKIREWGGAVLDTDGTVVFAAFGLPFGSSKGATGNPLETACAFALAYGAEAGSSYSFGVDYGPCACFGGGGWGLSAFGPPVFRSRILSALAPRYGATILIPEVWANQLPGVVEKKLQGTLEDKQGGPGIPFIELIDWKREPPEKALENAPENTESASPHNS